MEDDLRGDAILSMVEGSCGDGYRFLSIVRKEKEIEEQRLERHADGGTSKSSTAGNAEARRHLGAKRQKSWREVPRSILQSTRDVSFCYMFSIYPIGWLCCHDSPKFLPAGELDWLSYTHFYTSPPTPCEKFDGARGEEQDTVLLCQLACVSRCTPYHNRTHAI